MRDLGRGAWRGLCRSLLTLAILVTWAHGNTTLDTRLAPDLPPVVEVVAP